jgi:hypothetical protein
MRWERVGLSVFGAVTLLVLALTGTTVWLFLTNPVNVATAVNQGEVTPFLRDLAQVILEALAGLLKYL